MTRPCGSGTWRPARACAPSKATRRGQEREREPRWPARGLGQYDKTLRLWDLETGECLRTLEGHAAGS